MPSSSPLLRTTVVQAFARTIVDPSRREDGSVPSARTPIPESLGAPAIVLPGTGDVVGEHYRLLHLLGQGMFGKVYVAERVDVPEHQVALKLLPRSLYAGRNVERELVMLATVGHPHVVQLKDHGTTDAYVWLTMPVYSGKTLAERLDEGPLGLREAHDIFLPIARGLEALHAAGLRHQDIKPENIFLAVFGGRVHPILLDLGVAAEKDAAFVAGTALYAAPEQVLALAGIPPDTGLSEKMDTYGLATTLLYALVGPAHFPGETAVDRAEMSEAHEVRAKEPLAPAALPTLTGAPRELLADAFRRWLDLESARRPSMRELAEQLDVLLEQEREQAREEDRRRARQRSTILRFRVALGGMLLVGAAGAAVMYSKRETLRVANELEQARRKGAESFDKLDLCVASHRMAKSEALACADARVKDRADFKQALDEVMRSGSTTQAEQAQKVQSCLNRIKSCEDTTAAAQRAWGEERARILAEAAREQGALAAERDALKAALAAKQAELAEAEKQRDQYGDERRTCIEERDACRAAPHPSATPAAPPAPVIPAAVHPVPPADPAAPPAASASPPPPPSPPAPPTAPAQEAPSKVEAIPKAATPPASGEKAGP